MALGDSQFLDHVILRFMDICNVFQLLFLKLYAFAKCKSDEAGEFVDLPTLRANMAQGLFYGG